MAWLSENQMNLDLDLYYLATADALARKDVPGGKEALVVRGYCNGQLRIAQKGDCFGWLEQY